MHPGFATPEGASRYAKRFPQAEAASFFNTVEGCRVSSLGMGTYLGGIDDATDRSYIQAALAALRGGINFLDTSLNYRHQRSEKCIGAAIAELLESGEIQRDEFFVCTKAGFLVPGAIPAEVLSPADIAGNMHSMAPAFLRDQLARSRRNLGLETIDVFYLHNPETQLAYVSPGEFERRILTAFETLESLADEGQIRFYGTATWNGYRAAPDSSEALSLEKLVALARQAGGPGNRFRFIQLPFNLAMVEALSYPNQAVNGQRRPVLEAARHFGINVVASASLLQSRLCGHLPEALVERMPGACTDAQRALQFVRSAPGIAVALAGMGRPEHVAENLGLAAIPPYSAEEFRKVFA
jgi:aryl-alcohol dehydrogenase-like predicted oxidoreductase